MATSPTLPPDDRESRSSPEAAAAESTRALPGSGAAAARSGAAGARAGPAAPPAPAGLGTPAGTPLGAALDAVGDRWTLLLVEALLAGPRRFGDLQQELPGIAPNVLAGRLRRLEGEGLVLAEPYSERPRRFVYELTGAGQELAGALRLLADWGARHRDGGEPPRHAACGTPVEARWWCPTCERPVTGDEAAELHFA